MALKLKTHKKRTPLLGWTITTLFLGIATVAGLTGLNYMTGIGPSTIVAALGLPTSDEVSEVEVTPLNKATHTSAPTQPKLLTIRDLGIEDARIFGVELDSMNEVDSPKNVFDVGWYTESAKAEEAGVMLLDARSHGETQPGVFSGIGLLKPGMEVNVINGDNSKYTYIVKDVKKYDITELEGKNSSKLTEAHPDSHSSVHLITGTGRWVPALQTYDQRIVVRASQQ